MGFCVKNEMVQKGQLLMEICDPVVKPQPLFAIADTLPLSLTTKQLQILEVEICGQKIPFEMVRSIEDTISGKKLVLFQSLKCMELTRQHRGEGRCFSNDGVLLDKFIQIRW